MKNIKDFYKSLILSTAIYALFNTSTYSYEKTFRAIYTRNSYDIHHKYKYFKIEDIILAYIEYVEEDIINNIDDLKKTRKYKKYNYKK